MPWRHVAELVSVELDVAVPYQSEKKIPVRKQEKTKCNQLVMKLGSDGFIAYDRKSNNEIYSQAFPALSVNPLDVAGAGDSLLAIFATALASGHKMMSTAALACCMTATAVETMGNTPISAKKLARRLDEVFE